MMIFLLSTDDVPPYITSSASGASHPTLLNKSSVKVGPRVDPFPFKAAFGCHIAFRNVCRPFAEFAPTHDAHSKRSSFSFAELLGAEWTLTVFRDG